MFGVLPGRDVRLFSIEFGKVKLTCNLFAHCAREDQRCDVDGAQYGHVDRNVHREVISAMLHESVGVEGEPAPDVSKPG